ncbi:MAG: hypothetical protein U5N85_13945 [Arcicella sp.]|nr:hypothetical protein [Arcicella sp.]
MVDFLMYYGDKIFRKKRPFCVKTHQRLLATMCWGFIQLVQVPEKVVEELGLTVEEVDKLTSVVVELTS